MAALSVVGGATVGFAEPSAESPKSRTKPSRKDGSIESLRGLALVLMVAGHAIGNNADHGLHVPDDSIYRYFYCLTQFIRMPLFTVISGFVYALRPVVPGGEWAFVKGKSRRLLLPLVVVATLEFLSHRLIPGVNHAHHWSEMWRIYVFSFDHFWFLQAIFVVFLIVGALEVAGGLRSIKHWGLALAAALAFAHVAPKPEFFSLWGTVYLLPYFLLGVGLRRFASELQTRWTLGAAGVGLTLGVVLQQAVWFGWAAAPMGNTDWLSLLVGLTGCTLLFGLRRNWPMLGWLGEYSFTVYLFHVFGTAGGRILTHGLGLDSLPALLAISLGCGLLLPIAGYHLCCELDLRRRTRVLATR